MTSDASNQETMRVHVVLNMEDQNAIRMWPDICKAVESCMTVIDAKYKLEEKVAVIMGTTDNKLSVVTTALYGDDNVCARIISLEYKPNTTKPVMR